MKAGSKNKHKYKFFHNQYFAKFDEKVLGFCKREHRCLKFRHFGQFLTIFILAFSCKEKQGEVKIIKQWHLDSKTSTLDIEKSKNLPQFKNQKEVYTWSVEQIQNKKAKLIIAEGCEGEVNDQFRTKFNGWSLPMLKELVNDPEFSNIMAPVPLKLKAKFPKLRVLCGDSLELIKENLLAMSNLRGMLSYYQKFKKLNKFDNSNLYVKSFLEIYPEAKSKDLRVFSLNQAKKALEDFERFIHQRNRSFYRIALQNVESLPIIIIGGLHAENLVSLFSNDIKTSVPVLKNYSDEDQLYLTKLKKILDKEAEYDLIFSSVPKGFEVEKFVLKNLLNENELFSKKEGEQVKEMIKNKLNFQLLLSDFDADGIRDFTLSSHQNKLIISAEDTDWDNDGTPNLIDSTLGDFDLNINISPVSIDNHFQSMSSQAKVQAQLEKDFKLIQFDRNHELLVLDVFTKVIKKLGKEKFNIRFLSASSSQMKKGNNSFFSYSKLTKVLEYDPKHLYEFIKREEKKRFPGVEFPLLIRSYVIPIILHSLLHEIGHATKTDQKEWSLKNDWAWIETEYIGKYLNSFREEVKEIKTYKENLNYKNKTFREWSDLYNEYIKLLNNKKRLVKGSEEYKEWRKSPYFVDIPKLGESFQMSFSYRFKVPSLYALSSPEEFYAEVFASCYYPKFFPNVFNLKKAIETEHLIGLFPLRGSICDSL